MLKHATTQWINGFLAQLGFVHITRQHVSQRRLADTMTRYQTLRRQGLSP